MNSIIKYLNSKFFDDESLNKDIENLISDINSFGEDYFPPVDLNKVKRF